MTEEWSDACVEMSRDVNAVVKALFAAGITQVTVKDFHRTAYNLLPELIDPRAQVVSGYKRGPVPGIGHPDKAETVMFLGMHAASGTEGFMAHTLSSRISRLNVNGRVLAEVELFSASLAPFGVRPIFFSGCPVACGQAKEVIAGIHTYPIDKSPGREPFDADSWRSGLATSAVESINNSAAEPYALQGPIKAVLTMRDGEDTARKMALRWSFAY
jgi:D-amino peptidase